MFRLKINKDKKDYLIDLYEIISKNIQFEEEYNAVIDIVYKMYSYDIDLATNWSIELLNMYGGRILYNKNKDDNYIATIYSFIDTLIVYLTRFHDLDNVIKIIDDKIKKDEMKFLLLKYLFGPEDENNLFKKYFDQLINNKEYDYAYQIIKIIISRNDNVRKDIFNITEFLNSIIHSYTSNKEIIDNQKLLELLYSLVYLAPSEVDKAILETNFVDYI